MNYATMAFVNAIVMHITLTIQTTVWHIAYCVTIEHRQNYCSNRHTQTEVLHCWCTTRTHPQTVHAQLVGLTQ